MSHETHHAHCRFAKEHHTQSSHASTSPAAVQVGERTATTALSGGSNQEQNVAGSLPPETEALAAAGQTHHFWRLPLAGAAAQAGVEMLQTNTTQACSNAPSGLSHHSDGPAGTLVPASYSPAPLECGTTHASGEPTMQQPTWKHQKEPTTHHTKSLLTAAARVTCPLR